MSGAQIKKESPRLSFLILELLISQDIPRLNSVFNKTTHRSMGNHRAVAADNQKTRDKGIDKMCLQHLVQIPTPGQLQRE
ncbi:hypothetical protein HMPREF0322_02336 [Desulfitobacterium hafniense DP7]|uniref:Uncharacterized protein n=1 Tax=Desulfitobacterium hafniense DP7 TaxID=537010 RepID=G9XMZ6_DESHA|nr:hypothetical protein HMPREF0322_02336 [Desulfitobacterium hafniense DP7]